METITVQLQANYEKHVQNLQERIRGLEELGGKDRELRERELLGLREQLKGMQAQQGRRRRYW